MRGHVVQFEELSYVSPFEACVRAWVRMLMKTFNYLIILVLPLFVAAPALADSCSISMGGAIAGEHPDHLNGDASQHFENHFPRFSEPVTIFEDHRGKNIAVGKEMPEGEVQEDL